MLISFSFVVFRSSCNHLSVKDFKMHEVNLNFKESEIALEKEKNNRK